MYTISHFIFSPPELRPLFKKILPQTIFFEQKKLFSGLYNTGDRHNAIQTFRWVDHLEKRTVKQIYTDTRLGRRSPDRAR